MKKVALIGFFAVLLAVMSYQIISTSNKSNLFTLMANWGKPGIDPYPWFRATLWDFYANFLIIAFWVWYKETNKLVAGLWIVFLAAMGSPATALYVLFKLFGLKKEEGLAALITKQS